MIQMGKYKRVQMHSMKARLDEPVLEKLKSSSFAYRRKKNNRDYIKQTCLRRERMQLTAIKMAECELCSRAIVADSAEK